MISWFRQAKGIQEAGAQNGGIIIIELNSEINRFSSEVRLLRELLFTMINRLEKEKGQQTMTRPREFPQQYQCDHNQLFKNP